MKKYEFTKETKEIDTRFKTITLHRIRATAAFGAVKKGDLGGWIEKEENLSHDGNAWVYGNAWVGGNARVYDDAIVGGNARVYGNAEVYDNARVYGDAEVYGDAWVCSDTIVYGNARVYDDTIVYGNARVYDDTIVCNNAWVCGNAEVRGNARVDDNARVGGNAEIFSVSHVLVIGPIGSRNSFTTFYRDKDNEITVKCGCFLGKMERFLEKVEQTHGDSRYGQAYRAAAEIAKIQIDLEPENR